MRVGWVYSPFFLRHRTGASHPERPERLEAIVRALEQAGLLLCSPSPETRILNADSSSSHRVAASPRPRVSPLKILDFTSAPVEWLESVHEPAYVALVRMACEQGMGFIGDRETDICSESYDVARLAVGGVLAACDAVMAGTVTRAFCAVRPPGHHAGTEQGGGYCLFNNVAIGAEYLRRRHGLPRVAIVDWDVHHGNGTQQIFEGRRDVLFISLHETPAVQWPHTGYETEWGVGEGEGFTLNCPMLPGSGEAEYRRAFETQVIPALDRFAPSALLISAGFDAAAADDIANINLEPASFAWMTGQLAAVADRHCGGQMISVLEGGYDLPSLGRCVLAHVREMMRDEG